LPGSQPGGDAGGAEIGQRLCDDDPQHARNRPTTTTVQYRRVTSIARECRGAPLKLLVWSVRLIVSSATTSVLTGADH